MNSQNVTGTQNPERSESPDQRLTTLTYKLPLLPASLLDMGELLLHESVREFLQTTELLTWEQKESVILRAVIAVPEERASCYDTLSAIRQVSVEKGVRIRDLAENQALAKSLEHWGSEHRSRSSSENAGSNQQHFVTRDRVWHPRRSKVILASKLMNVESAFHALDGLLAFPPDHNRLFEFDEKGNVTRDVAGYVTQIPLLIVPFPESVTLTELCREIRMQLRRKQAKLRNEMFLYEPFPAAKPQLVRDELFDNNVASLIITGYEKRHVDLANAKGSTEILMFLYQLMGEGIELTLCGAPSAVDVFTNNDFRLVFKQAARTVSGIRIEEIVQYMSYFWNVVIGPDEPMADEFVEFAEAGLFQRELIRPYLIDFNRRVNRDGQDWRTAINKSMSALSGDLQLFHSVYRDAMKNGEILAVDARKYADEFPLGVLNRLVKVVDEVPMNGDKKVGKPRRSQS